MKCLILATIWGSETKLYWSVEQSQISTRCGVCQWLNRWLKATCSSQSVDLTTPRGMSSISDRRRLLLFTTPKPTQILGPSSQPLPLLTLSGFHGWDKKLVSVGIKLTLCPNPIFSPLSLSSWPAPIPLPCLKQPSLKAHWAPPLLLCLHILLTGKKKNMNQWRNTTTCWTISANLLNLAPIPCQPQPVAKNRWFYYQTQS